MLQKSNKNKNENVLSIIFEFSDDDSLDILNKRNSLFRLINDALGYSVVLIPLLS